MQSASAAGFIVGGEEAAEDAWPWQVLFLNDGDFTCGGSIIDSHWVVTAASCVYQ